MELRLALAIQVKNPDSGNDHWLEIYIPTQRD
jgi:hypothetical protein